MTKSEHITHQILQMPAAIKRTQASHPIASSICVSGSCSAPIGEVTYRGLHTDTREIVFRKSPMAQGTENIGTFLALVHALAYLHNRDHSWPVYTDCKVAIRWIKHRNIQTNLSRNKHNQEIFSLVNRAIAWLRTNNYPNAVLAWDKTLWGEIPSSFHPSPTAQSSDRAKPALKPSLKPSPKPTDAEAVVAISGRTYAFKEQLQKIGMVWHNNQWIGTFPLAKIDILKDFCRRYNLQYRVEGNGIKESRLARGLRPISGPSSTAVMGEGGIQWEIEETIHIEKQRRHRQRAQKKKQPKKK